MPIGSPHDETASVPPPPAAASAFPTAGTRVTGQLLGLFSFDIGYEIDLERARTLLPTSGGAEPVSRRAAPAYVGHTTRPLRLPLGETQVLVQGRSVAAATTMIVHEVGAVTIVLTLPLACEIAALPALTATLTGAGPLEDAARALVERHRAAIAPAVTRPSASDIVEDYYVIQIDCVEPACSIADLLARERAALAAALRCEPEPLSEPEVEDTLRPRLSYYPDDLAITDWNVAVLVDPDPWAAIDVLEYLNVQLLELRYFDALLDTRLVESYPLTVQRARRIPLLNAPLQRTVDELAAIGLEVASMVERLHNAFKLSGDVYLAKLHARTAERLGLRAWEASVQGKLDVLHQRYSLLVERVRAARSELLEATIVVLVAVELLLLLVGRG
jgi:hypothetical protein